jgi:diadenosine tetraphosphatase ApaH/serine/threonine PP2A family protein phosphatase
MSFDDLHAVYCAYEPLFLLEPDEVAQIGPVIPIPNFPINVHIDISQRLLVALSEKPAVIVDVPTPCIVIGDIHGNLHDLIRIFASISDPMSRRYLFLGDYVDRGSYSVDVLLLLFTLKLLYPTQFYLLRGNHEFKSVNETYGFKTEVVARFGDSEYWEYVDQTFCMMPLAAVLGGFALCVHGGIGPDIVTLGTIRSLDLPIETYDDRVVSELTWSDPSTDITGYEFSARGIGCLFGALAVKDFLDKVKMRFLIRAHQCVAHGISVFALRCITVFSSSEYQHSGNSAGFLEIGEDGEMEHRVLAPVTYIARKDARYTMIDPSTRRLGMANWASPMAAGPWTPLRRRSSQAFGPAARMRRAQSSETVPSFITVQTSSSLLPRLGPPPATV